MAFSFYNVYLPLSTSKLVASLVLVPVMPSTDHKVPYLDVINDPIHHSVTSLSGNDPQQLMAVLYKISDY